MFQESAKELTDSPFARARRCAPPRARWTGYVTVDEVHLLLQRVLAGTAGSVDFTETDILGVLRYL